MIVVKLMGGMGNQMFQYAIGRNLSLKYNLPLKIDLSFLKSRNMGPNFVYRDYDLDLFNVEEDFDLNSVDQIFTINEPHFQYSENLLNSISNLLYNKINVLFDGYWQTPLYFKEFESQIREDFKFKNTIENAEDIVKEMASKINSSNSVMINVRRTDYLNNDFHGVFETDYIYKSVDIIKSKINNPEFFVFSDDIEWCKQNIDLPNMTIVDHRYKGHKFNYYLQLMSSCKHFIIPNSSFAWWSAWLNTDNNKIVISPKKWFNREEINTKDLIPNDWIRI